MVILEDSFTAERMSCLIRKQNATPDTQAQGERQSKPPRTQHEKLMENSCSLEAG